MQVNLNPCLDLIIVENEGGYVDHPKDPGGPTNMGITLKTLTAWRKAPCTIADLKAITRTEVEAIMASEYATPIKFGSLPDGLDYSALDCAIHSGPSRAARILQSLLNVAEDGVIGEQTLAALNAYLQADSVHLPYLIEMYSQARLNFMRTLDTWSTFGAGWTSRVYRVEVRATTMAQGVTPVAKLPFVIDSVEEAGTAKAAGPQKLTATPQGQGAIAIVTTAVITAGSAATQASAFLTPYHNVKIIAEVLAGLAVIAAIGTCVATLTHAKRPAV